MNCQVCDENHTTGTLRFQCGHAAEACENCIEIAMEDWECREVCPSCDTACSEPLAKCIEIINACDNEAIKAKVIRSLGEFRLGQGFPQEL
jgi:hypothetical protein